MAPPPILHVYILYHKNVSLKRCLEASIIYRYGSRKVPATKADRFISMRYNVHEEVLQCR